MSSAENLVRPSFEINPDPVEDTLETIPDTHMPFPNEKIFPFSSETFDWEQFCQEIRAYAFTIAYAILGDTLDAQDVIQEALLKMITTKSFDPLRSKNIQSWYKTIVTRTALDKLRARKCRPQTKPFIDVYDNDQTTNEPGYGGLDGSNYPDIAEDIVNRHHSQIIKHTLHEAIAKLPIDQQTAIQYSLEGYSHGEIAELMAKPLGTVKGYINQAYKKMREYLEPGINNLLS